jgi:hypothetical protein
LSIESITHSDGAKGITDKSILKLIRGFLTAGVLTDGPPESVGRKAVSFSPMLSNPMLDLLDKELEEAGRRRNSPENSLQGHSAVVEAIRQYWMPTRFKTRP